MHLISLLRRYVPGVILSSTIALTAAVLQLFEILAWRHAIIEALVMAIVLGTLVRTIWGLEAYYKPGVDFTAKQVLELAIVLLGASVDLPALVRAGPVILLAIGFVVISGIVISSYLGRLLGLNPRLAILVACGNAICGNSAIAAVAPVIGADKEDVAASIALTAVLGLVVVLTLPVLIPLLGLSLYQYGVLAGMTVYAVPQVLAATFPISALSGEVGTLVKLVRVLLLGPVVLFYALRYARQRESTGYALSRFVPWFIIGFLLLAIARSVGVLPNLLADPLRELSRYLTIAAMAALGLGVDIRAVRRVGWPVALAVMSSLLVLITLSALLIKLIPISG